jgi:N-acetylmuramoyl-L-alanine amidase CwlA
MSVNIIQSLIPEGYQNRPSTNPKSKRYKIIIPPKWITVHNAWSAGDAHALNAYQKTAGCVSRPASWHLSVSNNLVVQGVPFGETAWHAGDYVNIANPGLGNTQSIGIEICDFYNYRTKTNNQELYLLAEEYCTLVIAHLIKTVPSLLKFPDCVVPHTKWRAASGCPSRILGRRNGWNDYLTRIEQKLKTNVPQPTPPAQSKTWHRVIAGSYSDMRNAEFVRQDLIRRGYQGTWIDTVKI